MRPFEEAIKKSIERESDKVCSGKFYLTAPNNESFVRLFTVLSSANEIFLRCLMNERLEKVIKDHIFTTLEFKNEESVITIQRVFLKPKHMVIGWSIYEEVLKRFFCKLIIRKNWGRADEIIFERENLQENILTLFSSLVLYPILLRKDTIRYRMITIDFLVNSIIYGNKDFSTITRILSVPLESQKEWK